MHLTNIIVSTESPSLISGKATVTTRNRFLNQCFQSSCFFLPVVLSCFVFFVFFLTFYLVVRLCSALLQEYMERLEKKDCSPFMCKQVKAGMSNRQDEVSISINRNDASMREEDHRPVSQQLNPRRQVNKAWANVDLCGLAESSGTQARFVCFSPVGITYYKMSRWILFYNKVQIYFLSTLSWMRSCL